MDDTKCGNCGRRMIERTMKYRGLTLKSSFCPPCNYDVFTEEQFDEAFRKIQQARLKESYTKRTIKIGNSIGITFPKDVAAAFQLGKKKVTMRPDVAKGTIAIEVG